MAANKKTYASRIVTRKEYMEYGSNICSTRFDTPKHLQETGVSEPIEDEEMY